MYIIISVFGFRELIGWWLKGNGCCQVIRMLTLHRFSHELQ